jgi:hypothetical protein
MFPKILFSSETCISYKPHDLKMWIGKLTVREINLIWFFLFLAYFNEMSWKVWSGFFESR